MAYGTINADVIGTSVAGSNLGAGNASIMKNRIINGAMVIDQRNAGASVTPASGDYTLDRWRYGASQASKFTVQQNAGSVTPPVGYKNYLGLTVASAVTIGASDYFELQQRIEGLNTYDLAWGTANAKTVTLSFQVYSSLTGTFGGGLQNSAGNRCYPFSYSIPVANTWTTISVTIAGDTSGTWLTTNGIGIITVFGLGVGSSLSGTAGAWGTVGDSATGATSVVGTNGATFYITAVQLEVGSSATGFEYRQYQQELALCQRYYYKTFPNGASKNLSASGQAYSTIGFVGYVPFPVPLRIRPTALEQSGTATDYAVSSATTSAIVCNSVIIYNAVTTTIIGGVEGTVASGLVAGNATNVNTSSSTGSNAYLAWSAEL